MIRRHAINASAISTFFKMPNALVVLFLMRIVGLALEEIVAPHAYQTRLILKRESVLPVQLSISIAFIVK